MSSSDKEIRHDVIPVLLGADLNCYSVARAFHEYSGVRAEAFGRYAVGASKYSKIVNFHIVPDMDAPDTCISVLNDFAAEHKDKKLVVLGCTDDYASLLIHGKDRLADNFIAPYIDPELADRLVDKADFYAMCDKYGILYPKTQVLDAGWKEDDLRSENLGFSYPVIVKPSNSIHYWKHPFSGMKKVYVAENEAEAVKIVSDIYSSGYPGRMIVQDRIPGDDSYMNVLTCYSGRDRKVKAACLGHVLLEEHTPKGLGNHTAILTESHPELVSGFRAMLDDLGYTGFSNFDIKYDERDGSYRAFEINLRQGRSNYYVTSAGMNIAQLIIGDHLGEGLSYTECDTEHFWYAVPKGVVRRYVRDKKLLTRIESAISEKRSTSSLWYAPDLVTNPVRLAYILMHLKNQYKKYKKYYII